MSRKRYRDEDCRQTERVLRGERPVARCCRVAILLILLGCGSTKTDDLRIPENTRSPEEKIDSLAVFPMDEKNYPRAFKDWGTSGVGLNSIQSLVARKAAESPECDRVVMVALSEQRSEPRKKAVFFVDCANEKRFYIADTEVDAQTIPVSQEQKMSALSDTDAINQCERLVIEQLQRPSTFDRKILSTGVRRAKTLGNLVVEFPFEAANGLGVLIEQKARCVFSSPVEVEVTITP